AAIGHTWNHLSAYLSYSYSHRDPLFGRDRDYVQKFGANGSLNPDITCVPGNVVIRSGTTTTNYALPALLPNTTNGCDLSDNLTLFTELTRHNGFGGLSVDFSDSVKLDVRSYYTSQSEWIGGGPFTSTSTITPTNPFYRPVNNPAQAALPQSVSYS